MLGTRRVCALALAALVGAASAQDYPSKPIVLVVPFPAGGPTDVVGRALAKAMSKSLKQGVSIDNAAGAGGTLGSSAVVRAAPDGHTLLLMHIGLSTAPALYRSLPFDPVTDLEPVGLVVDSPMVLIARRDLPAATLKALIPYLGANRGKVSLANAGLGSASHLCGLLFMSAIQTDLITIPYEGTAPALADLLGGRVDMLCDQTTHTMGPIKARKVRVYGLTTPSRLASMPEVPTLQEQGLPDFQVGVWHGLYAPKGTPGAVIERLSAALQAAIADPAFRARMAALGAEVYPADRATPRALATQLKTEIEKWTPIIRKAGIYAD